MRTAPIYGPRTYAQRCIDGRHVAVGTCHHAGGVMIGGSCYVHTAPRRVLVARTAIDGSTVYTVEALRRT